MEDAQRSFDLVFLPVSWNSLMLPKVANLLVVRKAITTTGNDPCPTWTKKTMRCPGVSLWLPRFRSDLCQDRAACYRGAVAREDANPFGGDSSVDLWNVSAWRKDVKSNPSVDQIDRRLNTNSVLVNHFQRCTKITVQGSPVCACSLLSRPEEFVEERGFLPWREQRITLSYGIFFDGLLRQGKIWQEHGKTINIFTISYITYLNNICWCW